MEIHAEAAANCSIAVEVDSSQLPSFRVRRLRATVSQSSWTSIKAAISNCDILVFDITPTKSLKSARRSIPRIRQKFTSSNVWLEIGFALGREKRVVLVHSKAGGHKNLPSDLQSLIIGHLPDNGRQVDVSLRNTLVNAIALLLSDGQTKERAECSTADE